MYFENVNGHIIVTLEGDKYVVDTGSPISFSFKNKKQLIIGDETFLFDNRIIISKEKAYWIVGIEVNGFIGNDVISKTGLTINYFTNEIFFKSLYRNNDELNRKTIELIYKDGYLLSNGIFISGKECMNSLIDTGAAVLSYVSKKYLNDNQKFDKFYYDRSNNGELYGNIYSTILDLNSWDTIIPIIVGAIEDNPALIANANYLKINSIISTKDLGSYGDIIFDFSKENPCLIILTKEKNFCAKDDPLIKR